MSQRYLVTPFGDISRFEEGDLKLEDFKKRLLSWAKECFIIGQLSHLEAREVSKKIHEDGLFDGSFLLEQCGILEDVTQMLPMTKEEAVTILKNMNKGNNLKEILIKRFGIKNEDLK